MNVNYYHSRASVNEYISLSKDVSGRELIEKFNLILPKKSTVLELGSGPGTDWKILSENHTVIGSDNSKEFLRHLNRQCPKGKFIELDAVSLNTQLKFDGIYSNKVLHHLTDHDLLQSAKKQSELLKGGGIICHSFWKGMGSEIFKGLFVNYHTKEDLEKVFNPYFDNLSIEPYAEFDTDDSLLLLGRNKSKE